MREAHEDSWYQFAPSDWCLHRIRDEFDLVNGFPYPTEGFNIDGIGMPLVRIRDILSPAFTTFFNGKVGLDTKVKRGDIVIGMDGDFNAVWWDRDEALLNQRVCALRPQKNSRLLSRFAFYQIGVPLKIINDLTPLSTVKHLSSLDVLSLRLPAPDFDAQKTIADFLDRETARIDQLIEKKERIALLSEERIESAISSTIRSAADTKEQPMRRYFKIVTGKTPSRSDEDNFSLDEGMPWATPSNLGYLKSVTSTKERITEAGLSGQPIVPPDTILVNGIGNVGKVGITGMTMTFNQQIHALIPKGNSFVAKYMLYALHSRKDEIVSLANNTTIPIINAERLGRLRIGCPDRTSQSNIALSLDRKSSIHLSLYDAISKSITRLREYRAALITAAVTGQIDVATWRKRSATEHRLDGIEAETPA